MKTNETTESLLTNIAVLGNIIKKYADVMEDSDIKKCSRILASSSLISFSEFLESLEDLCENESFECYLESEERINAFKEADIQAIRDGVEIAVPWHERIKNVYESDRVNWEELRCSESWSI